MLRSPLSWHCGGIRALVAAVVRWCFAPWSRHRQYPGAKSEVSWWKGGDCLNGRARIATTVLLAYGWKEYSRKRQKASKVGSPRELKSGKSKRTDIAAGSLGRFTFLKALVTSFRFWWRFSPKKTSGPLVWQRAILHALLVLWNNTLQNECSGMRWPVLLRENDSTASESEETSFEAFLEPCAKWIRERWIPFAQVRIRGSVERLTIVVTTSC